MLGQHFASACSMVCFLVRWDWHISLSFLLCFSLFLIFLLFLFYPSIQFIHSVYLFMVIATLSTLVYVYLQFSIRLLFIPLTLVDLWYLSLNCKPPQMCFWRRKVWLNKQYACIPPLHHLLVLHSCQESSAPGLGSGHQLG